MMKKEICIVKGTYIQLIKNLPFILVLNVKEKNS